MAVLPGLGCACLRAAGADRGAGLVLDPYHRRLARHKLLLLREAIFHGERGRALNLAEDLMAIFCAPVPQMHDHPEEVRIRPDTGTTEPGWPPDAA